MTHSSAKWLKEDWMSLLNTIYLAMLEHSRATKIGLEMIWSLLLLLGIAIRIRS